MIGNMQRGGCIGNSIRTPTGPFPPGRSNRNAPKKCSVPICSTNSGPSASCCGRSDRHPCLGSLRRFCAIHGYASVALTTPGLRSAPTVRSALRREYTPAQRLPYVAVPATRRRRPARRASLRADFAGRHPAAGLRQAAAIPGPPCLPTANHENSHVATLVRHSLTLAVTTATACGAIALFPRSTVKPVSRAVSFNHSKRDRRISLDSGSLI